MPRKYSRMNNCGAKGKDLTRAEDRVREGFSICAATNEFYIA